MTTFTEGRRPGEFILSEADRTRSREAIIVGASQTIVSSQVLGAKVVAASAAASASADAGNTASSGTIAMDATAPISSTAKNGRYVGVAVAATKVEWEDPYGVPIGVSTHGTAFTGGGLKFTITAGGSANVVGDKFYVDAIVEKGDLQYVAFNQDGTDGSQIAAAVAIYPATTGAGATAKISAIVRDAEVNGNVLAWPSDIEAAEKAVAIAALEARGIIVR